MNTWLGFLVIPVLIIAIFAYRYGCQKYVSKQRNARIEEELFGKLRWDEHIPKTIRILWAILISVILALPLILLPAIAPLAFVLYVGVSAYLLVSIFRTTMRLFAEVHEVEAHEYRRLIDRVRPTLGWLISIFVIPPLTYESYRVIGLTAILIGLAVSAPLWYIIIERITRYAPIKGERLTPSEIFEFQEAHIRAEQDQRTKAPVPLQRRTRIADDEYEVYYSHLPPWGEGQEGMSTREFADVVGFDETWKAKSVLDRWHRWGKVRKTMSGKGWRWSRTEH